MSARAIERRVASGRWKRIHPGVYVPRPVPSSWRQQLMGAVLAGGATAMASHRSAALLLGIAGDLGPVLEISVKSGGRIRGVTVHRRRDDPSFEVIGGIPATCVERTLLDLATVVRARQLGDALDEALRRRLTSPAKVRGLLKSLGPKGRRGSRVMRQLVEARDHPDAMAESRLESALLRVLRKHGVPLPEPQFKVIDGEVVVARLDFAYPKLKIGIEADGYRWHGSPERWRRGLRRENRLRLLGWTLLRFSWEDVQDGPELVASQVREALMGGERGIDRGT
jgi:very-short-patch-repair endonuclease